tara:strand:- start:3038 stop:4687 length:1650 start_codon:yes stop_codon:yes gene_type:complete
VRVAVIGAGPSGIVTLKELAEAGIDAVSYEANSDIGGVFRYDPNGGGVWDTCRLTSSATTTAFSDFPPRDTSPHQMLHSEYFEYLNDYVDHFGLRDRIHTSTQVRGVERQPNGQWLVSFHNQDSDHEELFDRIAFCVGLHQRPNIPKEVEAFDGEVFHSITYKGPEPFRDKHVLVIGAGESGADVIAEIAEVAKRCALSLRRGVAVLTRQRNGFPTDYFTTRLFYSLPKWLLRSVNPRGRVKKLRLLTILLTLPVILLLLPTVLLVEVWTRFRLGDRATPIKIIRENARLIRQSGGGVGDQFLTKSESFVHAIVDGKCTRVGALKSIDQQQVTFADGTSETFDAIMCCTGFDPSLTLLPDLKLRDLWKGCFCPELGEKVSFIGLVRPAIGAIPPIAEMQARLFALVCAGQIQLPSSATMQDEAAQDRAEKEAGFLLNIERMPYLVDYTSYMDDIARTIDCNPIAKELIKDPRLLYKFFCAHFMPVQYRLRGPGAKPETAKQQIRAQIVAYPSIYLVFNVIYLAFSQLMFRLGAKSFRPHLHVDFTQHKL